MELSPASSGKERAMKTSGAIALTGALYIAMPSVVFAQGAAIDMHDKLATQPFNQPCPEEAECVNPRGYQEVHGEEFSYKLRSNQLSWGPPRDEDRLGPFYRRGQVDWTAPHQVYSQLPASWSFHGGCAWASGASVEPGKCYQPQLGWRSVPEMGEAGVAIEDGRERSNQLWP